MVDQRLTAKTELVTPEGTDVIYVVDVSDTTDSPEGTSKKMQIGNLPSGGGSDINIDAGVFTGEFNVSNGLNNFYDDYDTGTALVLSLSTTPKLGSTCKVRINGDLITSYPLTWIFRGDSISTSATKINDILILYVSADEIILTNVLMNAPVVQLYPNDFNSEAIWQKFDIATTTESVGVVTSATDSLTTTPYPLTSTGSVVRSIQNAKECIYLDGTSYLQVANDSINSVFANSFSVSMKVKLIDGQPVAVASNLTAVSSDTTGRFWIRYLATGKLSIAYYAGGAGVFAESTNVVFSDGAMPDFISLIVRFQSGGSITCFIDGVEVPITGGDIAFITMANFVSDKLLTVGAYSNGTFTGNFYIKDYVIQPIIYNTEQIANLVSMP